MYDTLAQRETNPERKALLEKKAQEAFDQMME